MRNITVLLILMTSFCFSFFASASGDKIATTNTCNSDQTVTTVTHKTTVIASQTGHKTKARTAITQPSILLDSASDNFAIFIQNTRDIINITYMDKKACTQLS
jgi:hypothetical protein